MLTLLDDQNPITDVHEDSLIGHHLYYANESYDFISLEEKQAFDIDPKMAGFGITEERISAHKMKDDEIYLEVAALYDTNGFKSRSIE